MSRRAEHWQLPRWELAVFNPADPALDYGKWPSYALANDLIRAYFSHEGLYLPVLRKSDFERDYAMGRWRTDRAFARLSLLVFAVASRWVSSQEVYWAAQDDPLRPEDRAREIPTQSAGWRYLQEAIKLGNNLLALPNVSDLQAQVVSGIQAEDMLTLPALGHVRITILCPHDRLPHHLERVESLRRPSASSPQSFASLQDPCRAGRLPKNILVLDLPRSEYHFLAREDADAAHIRVCHFFEQ